MNIQKKSWLSVGILYEWIVQVVVIPNNNKPIIIFQNSRKRKRRMTMEATTFGTSSNNIFWFPWLFRMFPPGLVASVSLGGASVSIISGSSSSFFFVGILFRDTHKFGWYIFFGDGFTLSFFLLRHLLRLCGTTLDLPSWFSRVAANTPRRQNKISMSTLGGECR